MRDLHSWPGAVFHWLDERLDLTSLLARAREKRVPEHKHSHWYYWGGVCLFLFLVQGVTGTLLMVYYRPGPDAYDSVHQIAHQIQFGWLIRSIHAWSAQLMIGAVLVHMFSVFFMKAYRRPREFGWWTGLGLLGICLAFGFSGYLLPMDRLAYFATRVGLAMSEALPGVGHFISDLLRGGPDITSTTVQRFFTLHVIVFPALFVVLLSVHLWLVQKHGNAIPASEECKPVAERRSVPFFPTVILRDLTTWLGALNMLALLAVLFPWHLGLKADPLRAAPIGIHPEWYFMGPFEALKLLGRLAPGACGECIGICSIALGIILWGLVPLFDIQRAATWRGRFTSYFGVMVLIVLITLVIAGYIELP